ncbi:MULTISPECIES: hypothetical protein [Halomicrobium]|nr:MULTISPECIES: hypothetical protein [Halomicrobium]QCD66440.1 hypothetical protein E5139_12570 [Halomicrobium mukohataei]QFR21245.1 hypothetical protein GBQ70_12580 [Halomicrobium sp. ZPS1]
MSHIEYGFDVDAPQRRGRDAGTSQASTQSSSEPTSAQEVADAFDRASTIQEYESLTSSVTTQSPNLMTGEEWEKYNLVSAVGGQDSNFGELSITGNLYRYDPNEENVDANLYGSIHQYKAEHEYCGGCWLSHSLDRARLVQDWGVASSDTGNGGLGVYEPNEDREKTKDQVTYGLSVGGSFSSKDGFEVNAEGSIQWTYDIPKVPLQARSYDDAAIWEYDTSKYEAGDDFIVSTGSTCWFDPSDVDPDSPQVGQANMGAEFSSSVKTQYLGAILEYSEEY